MLTGPHLPVAEVGVGVAVVPDERALFGLHIAAVRGLGVHLAREQYDLSLLCQGLQGLHIFYSSQHSMTEGDTHLQDAKHRLAQSSQSAVVQGCKVGIFPAQQAAWLAGRQSTLSQVDRPRGSVRLTDSGEPDLSMRNDETNLASIFSKDKG